MVGRNVLHYQLLEKIGSGAMGEVYKAQDTRLNRFVAIKLLPEGKTGDPERRRRFIQEARAASALNHPNIVTIYDVVSDGDLECIVMEYVGGKTLLEHIPNCGMGVPQALLYGIQIADALGAAHAAGIVHRDLKPGNIMITSADLVKVLDFGLAKLMDSSPAVQLDETVAVSGPALTVEGAILGTISYISPEQAQGKKVDGRSDMFSFGAVAYEMVTGRRAFERDSTIATLAAVLRDEPEPMANFVPSVPPALEQIVGRCLSKDPQARWESMHQVEEELIALKRQSDSGELFKPVIPPPKKNPARTFAGGAIGLALVVACVAGWWWSMRRNAPAIPPPSVPPPASAQSAPGSALTPAPAAPADTTLTNNGIVELVRARTPVSLILDQIRSSKTRFNLSTQEVIRLVKAGVPETVIEAMRGPGHAPPPADSNAAATAPSPAPPSPAPPTPPPPAPAEPPPAAAPASLVALGDGLPMEITLDQDIPSDAEPGQPLRFTVVEDFHVASATVVKQGAAVTGEIVQAAGKKKFLGRAIKLTFRLAKAQAIDGRQLNVRATARGGADLSRPVETGKSPKSKELAAARGTAYIAYIDGEQAVSIPGRAAQ